MTKAAMGKQNIDGETFPHHVMKVHTEFLLTPRAHLH